MAPHMDPQRCCRPVQHFTDKRGGRHCRNWFGYYSVAVWTIILTVLAAVAFSTPHFWAE